MDETEDRADLAAATSAQDEPTPPTGADAAQPITLTQAMHPDLANESPEQAEANVPPPDGAANPKDAPVLALTPATPAPVPSALSVPSVPSIQPARARGRWSMRILLTSRTWRMRAVALLGAFVLVLSGLLLAWGSGAMGVMGVMGVMAGGSSASTRLATAVNTATPTATDTATATATATPKPTAAPVKYQPPTVVNGGGAPPPPPIPVGVPPGPGPTPAGGVPNIGGQVVLVNLGQQWLWVYQDRTLVYDTPVTTGMPQLPTPVGIFSIQWREANVMFISPWPQGSPYYYAPEHVNYAMYFAWNGYFLHDAPWRHCFGPGTNVPHTCADGTSETGSHGCVNLPTPAGAWIYANVSNGATVDIINRAPPPPPPPTPTPTPSPPPTPSPTATDTPTPSPAPTQSPSPSPSPSPTATEAPTPTAVPTATGTPTPTS